MNGITLDAAAARHALAPLGPPPTRESVEDRHARVVWCQLTEPGDSVAGRMVAALGPAAALRAMLDAVTVDEVTPRELSDARKRWLPRWDATRLADAIAIAAARGVTLVTPADAHWPMQLDDLGMHAPLCLWVRGDPSVLTRVESSVAIVGARAASRYGEHIAMELSADLTGAGIPVVSGGAYGIDGAAHRAALTVGGLTVALLAGGADRAYPTGHTQMIDEIAFRGAVASEVLCGSAPTKWRFLQRNRLIAALAAATVVVEAGWRSGSLNTAGHAAALGRPLGAVPGPVTSATSAGTHRLIREYGAECITSADDVRELIGFAPRAASAAPSGHDREASRITDALSTRSGRDVVDVAQRAGMTVEETTGILGLLALSGDVERGADGWRLTPRRR